MKRAFALMLMTTGLCAGLVNGSAALAAGHSQQLMPAGSLTSRIAPDALRTLIDDDGDEGEANWFWSLSGEDDDDDDECEDDDEGGGADGNNCTAGAAGNAARAGTVAPPKNGLFTNGTAPVVQSN